MIIKKIINKRYLIYCVLGALLACGIVVVMKSEVTFHNKHIEDLSEKYKAIDNRLEAISDSINKLTSTVESLNSERKTEKENYSKIQKTLTSLQKDVSDMKSSRSANSTSDKTDLKKLQISDDLLKSSKSISELKKDITTLEDKLFQEKTSESFWQKQKRILKEKFSKIVKIKKIGDTDSDDYNDKQKFEKAKELLFNNNLEKSLEFLEKIKLENEALKELILNIRKRLELDKTFENFKKEF